MLRQLRKTAGSPESGLPASNINAADGYENQLSATAEMINTSSARGTAAFTLKVNPSLFSCVKISTEISEVFEGFIASSPSCDFGSTVTSSWAVAVLRSQNELSLYASEKMPEQNNRPGIARRYRLIKSNSAPAPITARETEPSKLTTKSALTDNSLNTIRSSNSRFTFTCTTNLLVQGLGACPRRFEPCVFLPSRNLEDFVSKGSSASSFRSISEKTTRSGNDTDFVLRSRAARKRRNKTTSALLFKNVEQKPAFSY
ncbi:hypothetical protein [Parasutterella sp.]|uniref:hypothetical protein n=1 Tax=Parasutterella sp. TaxID=2049037 RepID=UPI003AF15D46